MSRTIRQWHSYFGVFIAPSVLFFALTGAVQIFNLHEAHGSYVPAAIVEKFSKLHKDQVFAAGGHHHDDPHPNEATPGDAPPAAKHHDDDDDKVKPATLVLKYFFLLVAICLAISTCFGLWMGLTQTRRKSLAWGLLIAGLFIPLGLVLAA